MFSQKNGAVMSGKKLSGVCIFSSSLCVCRLAHKKIHLWNSNSVGLEESPKGASVSWVRVPPVPCHDLPLLTLGKILLLNPCVELSRGVVIDVRL